MDPKEPGDRRPPRADLPDPITQARFLARPDVQPLFHALMDLRALRAQIRHDHYVAQTIEALLEIARTTDDLVEKRRAATAVVRLLFPSCSRGSAPSAPSASPPVPVLRDEGARRAPASAPSSDPLPRVPRSSEAAPSPTPSSSPLPAPGAEQAKPTTPLPSPGAPSPAGAKLPALPGSTLRDELIADPRAQRRGRKERSAPRRSRTQSLALAAGAIPIDST